MKKFLLLLSFLIVSSLFASSQQSFWSVYTAALRGDQAAQYKTGVMFQQGIGVDRNQSQAAKWYEKAAIQGHMSAQYNIGLMYANGDGVEQNEQFALMWLASAAKQGDKEARKILLALIDGNEKRQKVVRNNDKESDNIKAVAFRTKEGARVCSSKGVCEPCKPNTLFTSARKRGNYYLISGIGTPNGWKAYDKEGWIEESSIEIRR